MCNDCWKGTKLWCRAFTKTERCLTLFEAILLVILLALIVFLILHFLACSNLDRDVICGIGNQNSNNYIPIKPVHYVTQLYITSPKSSRSTKCTTEDSTEDWKTTAIDCTWHPSVKTPAGRKYYLSTTTKPLFRKASLDFRHTSTSDGEEVNDDLKKSILALVKLSPTSHVFGCVLTAIHRLWTVTAASCLELVEEMDSLHAYVIMENYGHVRSGRKHNVTDIIVHPLFRGGNRSYDLAGVKSRGSLLRRPYLRVASPLDFSTVCMGEMFNVLGFGKFRSNSEANERIATSASVWMMDRSLCESEYTTPSERNQGRYPSICAAVLYARGVPCNYCAGSPIIINRIIYGIMSYNEKCGITCEPTLYVNMAAKHVQLWIHELTEYKTVNHLNHSMNHLM